MFTDISLARLDEVLPELKRRTIQVDALVPSLNIQVVQGYRTYFEQALIWAEGRTRPGIPCVHDGITRPIGTCPIHPFGLPVTDAKAGYSAHNFGYAVDLCPFDIMPGQPDWNIAHPAWRKMLAAGLTCGLAEGAAWRTFPDNPHFYPQELPANPTDDMRRILLADGLPAVWKTFPSTVYISS